MSALAIVPRSPRTRPTERTGGIEPPTRTRSPFRSHLERIDLDDTSTVPTRERARLAEGTDAPSTTASIPRTRVRNPQQRSEEELPLTGLGPQAMPILEPSPPELVLIEPGVASLGAQPPVPASPTRPVEAPPAPAPRPPAAPLTPLEHAVYDLLQKLEAAQPTFEDPTDGEIVAERADTPTMCTPVIHIPSVTRPTSDHETNPVTTPRAVELPEEPLNPSHVHLVIDNGDERLVVTVAVRGTDVNVAFRGGDDATTASLARNAGSLEHAMRARKLDLASFTAERDESRRQPTQHHTQDPEPDERFALEEAQ